MRAAKVTGRREQLGRGGADSLLPRQVGGARRSTDQSQGRAHARNMRDSSRSRRRHRKCSHCQPKVAQRNDKRVRRGHRTSLRKTYAAPEYRRDTQEGAKGWQARVSAPLSSAMHPWKCRIIATARPRRCRCQAASSGQYPSASTRCQRRLCKSRPDAEAWMSSSAHPAPQSSAKRSSHTFLGPGKSTKTNQNAPAGHSAVQLNNQPRKSQQCAVQHETAAHESPQFVRRVVAALDQLELVLQEWR